MSLLSLSNSTSSYFGNKKRKYASGLLKEVAYFRRVEGGMVQARSHRPTIAVTPAPPPPPTFLGPTLLITNQKLKQRALHLRDIPPPI